MAAKTNRILAKSLNFSSPPFRKLSNITIDLSDRLTLIAGHNGIGKSTILGLLSNTFGLTETSNKSYFGEPFYANIERIVYLALDEVDKAKESPASAPVVVADVQGEEVKKRCALTKRNIYKRARVVPRTIDKSDTDIVGQDAKIPLPTIYLGIRRLASIGEADEREVSITELDMHDEDKALMADFIGKIIIRSGVNTNITNQHIKGSKKQTAHPGYSGHNALAVSVGQDSLASIATALASFNQLKRDLGERYPGGLLVIDEMDVGFHPHAITRLAKQLKSFARRLDLQIVATTHSPTLIEAVHPEGDGHNNSPDKVLYLLDTAHPRLAEDQSLSAILDDMAQKDEPVPAPARRRKKPVLGVYFEDSEAVQYLEELIPESERKALAKEHGVSLQLIGLGVGGSSLLGFPTKDPIFADRVLVVDGDTSIPKTASDRGNAVKLPCVAGSSGTNRSPENTIKAFLKKMITEGDGQFHDALLNLRMRNPSSDKVFTRFFDGINTESDERESTKAWWIHSFPALKQWEVIKQWTVLYPNETGAFKKAFADAIGSVAKRLHSSAGQAGKT